ncbi:GNAT family N-acetyltransferase [Pikeienuella piscinae]|uniref:GNAT family N-acetyltransferase n=1 Tax=Pikeienuella piscinae TaxID=2748098 RepID=A0A7M3T569_9RHOB|nr:GNAT family N-acetyltransferase [Pikeienuella piscinae]QIE57150.1 GNAT family N-acetyltransferase [Pikeienuella piscinae]
MRPEPTRLFAALEATWPPAETVDEAGWRLRRGGGGGRRVSAATRLPDAPPADREGVAAAAAAMAKWGQAPLFQVRAGDEALDALLAEEGYHLADPTRIFVSDAAALLDDKPEVGRVLRGACRVALIEEIWAAGGIGAERLAVMERAPSPRTYLIGRLGDRPASVAFAATDGEITMIHAVETLAAQRRKGAARMLMAAAARFAEETGARWLALAATERNAAAGALYHRLGMQVATRYHYRVKPA